MTELEEPATWNWAAREDFRRHFAGLHSYPARWSPANDCFQSEYVQTRWEQWLVLRGYQDMEIDAFAHA